MAEKPPAKKPVILKLPFSGGNSVGLDRQTAGCMAAAVLVQVLLLLFTRHDPSMALFALLCAQSILPSVLLRILSTRFFKTVLKGEHGPSTAKITALIIRCRLEISGVYTAFVLYAVILAGLAWSFITFVPGYEVPCLLVFALLSGLTAGFELRISLALRASALAVSKTRAQVYSRKF